jgi:hypothetical protein
MYLRYYHTVRMPVLHQFMGWIGNLRNLVIVRQDCRVVITQYPHSPDLGIGEILIQGDNPIVLYRESRSGLIEGKEN